MFVYPTWWSGQPAMLTGLARPCAAAGCRVGASGRVHEDHRSTHQRRRLIAVTSHGSSRFLNVLEGETGRRVLGTPVRVLCHRFAHTTWLGCCYNVDRRRAAEREGLARVEHRMGRLSTAATERLVPVVKVVTTST